MKIFFAGGDNWKNFEILKETGVKHVLLSYYYIKNKPRILEEAKLNNMEVLLDSGAHTLQKGVKVDYETFVDNYIKFINKYSKYIDYFVELDIENVIGLNKVEEWREKIQKQTKREPIIVWHRERGWNYWKQMCKQYSYIGFSGFVTINGKPEVPDKYIPIFLKEAKKHNTKVHGFGFTKPSLFKYPFYSVDSTSWLVGARYGYIYLQVRNNLKALNKKSFYRKYGRVFDFRGDTINRWNLLQWIKYANYLEKI